SRYNIHGAMNAETLETVALFSEDNVNADSTIDLFNYLESVYPQAKTIYVIADNARYHYSVTVQDWLKTSRIKLVFLPAYSPELNLIERLWRVFRKNVLYNRYYEKYNTFKKACENFFRNQDKYYEEIFSIMGNGLAEFAD
ncbi:IS630 family transposase, partial [Spartinivicinus poritis]